MDYFKHYSTASDSKSMNNLFDKMGHRGIAFWWMLVELCTENWDGKSDPKFSFHPRLVATKLKTRSNLVPPFLELCSNLGMGKFEVSSTKIEIDLPNLLDIKEARTRFGRLRKANSDIIRIEQEQEQEYISPTPLENFEASRNFNPSAWLGPEKNLPEIQPQVFRNSKGPTPDDIIQRFNDTLAGKGKIKHCRGLSGTDIQEFITTISFPEFRKIETWDEVFQNAALSPFLLGQERSSWVVTLDWLVKHKNALKVLNGAFNGGGEKDLDEWAKSITLEGA